MEKKPTSGLAVAALIMGIIAFAASFIPLLNIMSFIFVVLAIVFGAVGLIVIAKGAKGGKGLAIAGLALGILALLVTVVMYSGAAGQTDDDAAPTASDAPSAAQTEQGGSAEPAAQDEKQVDYAVTIDGCRVAEDYAGEPVAVVTYTFTNNSDEATSFMVALRPQAFQGGVELNTAIGSDWDSEKYLSDVKPGATTTVEIGYELEDMSDVTVEVTELISFDDAILAEQTFSLS